jgi:hypothetical protein
MRKVFIGLIGLTMVLVSCNKRWQEEGLYYRAPNWTSDGKIVFMRDHYIQKFEQDPFWGGTRQIGGHQEIFVCEIDVDGSNFREVCKIVDEDFERGWNHIPISTSSAGDYIVISKEDWTKGEHYTEMFIMKRDGTGLKNLGEGSYPDLSPDGKKIVYQKPNQGLWIKNIDGSGDRQIVADENAMQPAWSPDNYRIAYVKFQQELLIVIDTIGQSLITIVPLEGGWYEKPDWGPADSNAIISYVNGRGRGEICYLAGDSLISKQEKFLSGSNWKWSPQGSCFIGYDSEGYFVINRDGSNKWYLKP